MVLADQILRKRRARERAEGIARGKAEGRAKGAEEALKRVREAAKGLDKVDREDLLRIIEEVRKDLKSERAGG